jgi:superfamily II DNA or RNA helicase
MFKFHSWPEVEQTLISAENHIKGELFEQLTEFYLKWDAKYRALLSSVWRLKDVPSHILEILQLPSYDLGIDLIAKTHEGKFWAVQCKYHGDTTRKISHREISTFLALSNAVASHIDFSLVVTTADDFARLYKGQSKIGFVLSDTWQALPESFFTDFRSKTITPAIISRLPRPHQEKAIEEATVYFQNSSRGKLLFPCGAGKSLTGYWIAKNLKAQTILVAVPSLALVKQTMEDYCRESFTDGQAIVPICICSDEGIGKNDDVAVYTQDLGVACTTDRHRIKEFLEFKTDRIKVVFTTYQSGRVLGDVARDLRFKFDVGIMDESHKTVGATDKLFSFLLFDENIRIEKRIFMTATERRYKGSSDNILSMDDVSVYGETFSHLSFRNAIEQEILSDYKIITLVVSKDEIKQYLKNNEFVRSAGLSSENDVDFRSLASLVALRKAMLKFPIKHTVTFHSSIKKAEIFQKMQKPFEEGYPDFGKVQSFHVTGAQPTSIRSKIIREFSGAELGIITNAKCLTEGVDVPNIDCVLFADPRKSTIDIVQAVGRALRRSKGKDFGYVLLPVYAEELDKENIIESEDFQAVLSTLRALASNDERIVEYFRDKQRDGTKNSNDPLVQFEIDEVVSQNLNTDILLDSIELKAWNRLAMLSWEPFEEARNFASTSGITTSAEWKKNKVSKKLPSGIPGHPQTVYKGNGWVSWAHFLGTDNVRIKNYLEYNEARSFVVRLGLKNTQEWKKWSRTHRPDNIPGTPDKIYQDSGWVSWAEFLGADISQKGNSLSYDEAKTAIKKFKIRSSVAWRDFSKSKERPKNVPANPDRHYKDNGWLGWDDFLGITHKIELLDYNSASELVKSLNIKTVKEFKLKRFQFRLYQLPSKPNEVYKSEWTDWETFFGIDKPEFLPYLSAHEMVKSQGILNKKEWLIFWQTSNIKQKIPRRPDLYYDEFTNWKHWLGNAENRRNKWKAFAEARQYVHSLKLKNEFDWRQLVKSGNLPSDIPKSPSNIYIEWQGMGDWLGTGNVAAKNKEFLTFEEAKRIVQNFKIKTQKELKQFILSDNCPMGFPSNPTATYKDKWNGIGDFLGTNSIAPQHRKFYSFQEARAVVMKNKIKSKEEYYELKKRDPMLPNSPKTKYNEFSNWYHFLGKEQKDFYTLVVLKAILKEKGIKTQKAYKNYLKIDHRAPSNPNSHYANEWKSFGDLFGTNKVSSQHPG